MIDLASLVLLEETDRLAGHDRAGLQPISRNQVAAV
jgi:hypothetical protein